MLPHDDRKDCVRMGAVSGRGELVHRDTTRDAGGAYRLQDHSETYPSGLEGKSSFH